MKPFRLPRDNKSLFDLTSHGRAGSGRRMHLSPGEIALIHRTVTRTPEVMIKVTGGAGSGTGRGVVAHFNYIGRGGDLEIETDDGERLVGKDAGQQLIQDWDLDMDEDRKRTDLFAFNRRKPPKLVHKMIFSMPAGTPPRRCWPPSASLPARNSGGSIGTRWCCTRTSLIRTCMSSSRR